MDRDSFAREVHAVLAHLHNRAYLESSPLAAAFGTSDRRLSGDAVQRLLVEAIEQLKPTQASPTAVTDWRRYRHLVLRDLEGRSLSQIMAEQSVSNRQASRDYQQAVQTLVALLWVRRSVGVPAALAESPDRAAARASPWEQAPDEVADAVDLAEVVGGVVATLEALLADRDVLVELALPDSLPPIAVDRAMLRQSLLHLLTYVIETTPAESVVVAASEAPGEVVLRCGPIALRDGDVRLVDSGRHLLAGHGARVELLADAGELFVRLPAVEQRTVLVIDDNPDIAGLFRRYLRGRPYRVTQATTGPSGLRLALELRPDAVVLDVLLPSEDGWETLRHFRETPALANTPVIVASVLPEEALARSLRVAEFLPKPVSRPALIAALERCCSARARPRDPTEPSASPPPR